MAFDPLSWALGTAATTLSKKAAKLLFPEDLNSHLRTAAKKWAEQLPRHMRTPPEPLFAIVHLQPGEQAPVAITKMRTLLNEGRIPTAEVWNAALVEQWEERKRALGTSANPFFSASLDDVREELRKLAEAFERVCVGEASLFQRTALDRLDLLVEHTRVIREDVQRILPYVSVAPDLAATSTDALFSSLFVCESETLRCIGVAVSNSGLVTCISGANRITSVRSVASGEVHEVEYYLSDGPLVHIFRIRPDTRGVVPAYTRGFSFDDRTSPWKVIDVDGDLRRVDEVTISLTAHLKIFGFVGWLDGLVSARTDARPVEFTPGPVFNARDELVGLSLALWETRGEQDDKPQYEYVIQPWASIFQCLAVIVERLPPLEPDATGISPLADPG